MAFYSRWTLQSIPELAPFTQAERVLLWNRAAKAVGQERWFRIGLLMGVIGGFGGGVGSKLAHPLVGSAVRGLASAIVVSLLMTGPIRRRLKDEILRVRRVLPNHALEPTARVRNG